MIVTIEENGAGYMRKYSVLMMLGLLSMLLLGLQLSASPTNASIIEAEQVKFEPKLFHLNMPENVTVHVKFPEPYERNVTYVNASTVLLERSIPPMNSWKTRAPPEFVAEFDGYIVASIINATISHMGVTTPHSWVPTKVELQISGELFDGTKWVGVGKIKIMIPET
jgi:hypothetical protein